MHPGGRPQIVRRDGFKDRPRANEQIRVHYVRVIGSDKKPIGILPIRDAIQLARRQELDLVELAPNADPPVCGILDFGKYIYQQKVKDRESKKKAHSVQVRELRFMMRISEHDYQTKLKKIREFLSDRDRVRVSLRLRGREVLHKDIGMKLFDRLRADVGDLAGVESEPRVFGEGRQSIQAMFVPKHENIKVSSQTHEAVGHGKTPAPTGGQKPQHVEQVPQAQAPAQRLEDVPEGNPKED